MIVKRIFDLLLASCALLLISPVLLCAMLAVQLTMGAPVFFRQQRPGLNGKLFQMVKLRTMLNTLDENGEPLPDEKRLTRLGKLLRATSLDEFPEFWNVLKGEMSLVGPRPLLMEYLPLYNERQRRRHEVKPGVTGWAQVNGRNAISWDEKFELDVWYVENRSLWLDVKILFLTVWKVFRRDGISSDEHVTMDKFSGSEKLDF